jgi:hypothetical protein
MLPLDITTHELPVWLKNLVFLGILLATIINIFKSMSTIGHSRIMRFIANELTTNGGFKPNDRKHTTVKDAALSAATDSLTAVAQNDAIIRWQHQHEQEDARQFRELKDVQVTTLKLLETRATEDKRSAEEIKSALEQEKMEAAQRAVVVKAAVDLVNGTAAKVMGESEMLREENLRLKRELDTRS